MKFNLNLHYFFIINICILFGLLNFVDGRGGAAEFQPLVLRFFDSGYLKNDFFLNSTEEFNIRYYIVRYIALFSSYFGVKQSLHVTGIISFILTLFLIYLISFKITKNFFASTIALFFAMLPRNAGLDLGDWYLVNNQITANQLVMPLILGGFYFVLVNKNIIALFLFSILSLCHSMLGLELLSILIFYIILNEKENTKKIIAIVVFSIILAKNINQLLDLKDLFYLNPLKLKEILIDLRHPHHYLIFYNGYWSPLIFSISLIFCWRKLYINSVIPIKFLNIFFLIMIPLAILSVISIYYYPLRIAISSIPFRLLSVIGYLVIIIGLGITISQTFKLYHYKLDLIIIRPYQYLILIFFTFTFSFLALVSYQNKRFEVINHVFNGIIQKDYEYKDLEDFSIQVSKLTPPEAMIITKISQIRRLSNRAILEGSQFPFVDKYMDQWYLRQQELSLAINDDGLERLKSKYASKVKLFAIIEREQETNFTKLHCDDSLCLIKL